MKLELSKVSRGVKRDTTCELEGGQSRKEYVKPGAWNLFATLGSY